METSISYYLWLFIVFLYLLRKHFQKTNKRLPPSPSLSFPIIGHLYLFKKPLHRTLAKLSEKYGPVLYLKLGSRPVLIVSSPSAAEECFTKNDISFANRPKLLAGKHLGCNYTTVMWAPYGSHWRNMRRIASIELLSSSRLQMCHGIRADEVRSLICKLFRGSNGGEFHIVDMKTTFFELTLNVLMRVIAGKRYYGEDIADSSEAKRFEQLVKESVHLTGANYIGDYLPVLKYVGSGSLEKRLVKLQKKRDEFMQSLIEERRKVQGGCVSEQKSKTMVDVLLSLQATEPEYYTDEIIRGMMQIMLTAGTDTSAGNMEWTLSLLLNNPEALAKAQTEIDTKIGQSRLIVESDLANLPYLHCIIRETLRMYPPATILHESSEDSTVGGFNVPRGTMLIMNAWAIHHDPKLWEQPEQFKPERFQIEQEERDGFKYMPFGTGRRGCPGEGLANRIVGLAIGSVIQCFEWERSGEEMVDMTEGTGLTIFKAHPLLAKCRPRQTMLPFLSQL
ncbi:PREDICTED: cytochrome P450 81D11-like [Fragaria vesca subsp. vesca]|uniref:cytochrome P450 81D11-like n=1 Tax=Fragaria vesca subsp. vesca TaxID=101020 RepID=UPI0002C32A3E|nr:PREDICTED: cytochrome P450 81D11-like [Fragaria vesca subsp. vesca]